MDGPNSQISAASGRGTVLELDKYQGTSQQTDRNERQGFGGLGLPMLGLFGEVGSLLSELKKKQRDKDSYTGYRDSVIEELGDVLWYFSNIAYRAGLSLSGVARLAADAAEGSPPASAGARTFADLQPGHRGFTGPLSGEAVERGLLALAGKVGLLLSDFSSGRIDSNRDVLSGHLVQIFRDIMAAANDADVSLNEAARRNAEKTLSRWPTEHMYSPPYDEAFDPDEQLPRRIEMQFVEKTIDGKTYVLQKCSGINIGDRLTDNRVEADDYRFHDVFHLGYAAILGWSPVMRALFKVKRKSRPEIDENQDGARAILIEEGIATWVFNHGSRLNDFATISQLDYALLKAVRELVKGYEVEDRPLWQWERAILEGFRVFRELRKHRGGTVVADLPMHTLEFREPPR